MSSDGWQAWQLLCACQWGRCGWCHQGRHDQCSTRRDPEWYDRPIPETHLSGRDGVSVPVWLVGYPCRWRCACGCPPHTPAPAPRPEPVRVRVVQPCLF